MLYILFCLKSICASVLSSLLQLTKNRFAGDLGRVPLKFNPESLTLSAYGTAQHYQVSSATKTSSIHPNSCYKFTSKKQTENVHSVPTTDHSHSTGKSEIHVKLPKGATPLTRKAKKHYGQKHMSETSQVNGVLVNSVTVSPAAVARINHDQLNRAE